MNTVYKITMPIGSRLGTNALGHIFLCYSFDQFNKPGHINPDVQRQTTEALLTGSHPPVESCMKPEFIRLAPPLHMSDDEVTNSRHSMLSLYNTLDMCRCRKYV